MKTNVWFMKLAKRKVSTENKSSQLILFMYWTELLSLHVVCNISGGKKKLISFKFDKLKYI